MITERLRKYAVSTTVLAGVLLAVAPGSAMIIENRLINAVYILPLLLLAAGLRTLGARTRRDLAGSIGYWMSLLGTVVSILGSALEALFPPAMLAEWGIAGGIVFFVGVYLLLFGGLFLGGGLLRTTTLPRAGPILLALSFPLAVIGLRVFNAIGWQEFNWIPFSVSYGLAWVLLGMALVNRRQRRNRTTRKARSTS